MQIGVDIKTAYFRKKLIVTTHDDTMTYLFVRKQKKLVIHKVKAVFI